MELLSLGGIGLILLVEGVLEMGRSSPPSNHGGGGGQGSSFFGEWLATTLGEWKGGRARARGMASPKHSAKIPSGELMRR